MTLTINDIDNILTEYDSEECDDVRSARRMLHQCDEEMDRLEQRRLDLLDLLEQREAALLDTANHEGWEV